jgi:hypothetical protein
LYTLVTPAIKKQDGRDLYSFFIYLLLLVTMCRMCEYFWCNAMVRDSNLIQ